MIDNPFVTIVRRLMGERPGMGSELIMPDRLGEVFAAVSGAAINVSQTVTIPDVSFWQGEIDFARTKAAGAAGVIIRAGQRTWIDSQFKVNWQKAKEAGLPRASYFFCSKYAKGKNQAVTYWDIVKNDVGEGFLCADYETGAWLDWNELYNFIYELQQKSGFPNHKVFIYRIS